MHDSPSSENNNSSFRDKSNYDFEDLLDDYSCGGSPDKIMIDAPKELNISNIKDFLW